MIEKVILVDENDQEIGVMEKMEAHQKGILHRAFSVLIFNSKGEWLIHKRAANKYHSASLWTNACCSHPRPGEPIEVAAQRRLEEEMGISLHPVFSHKFIYRADLDKNLAEHEIDYVFTGRFSGIPNINPHEVEEWKFVELEWLKLDLLRNEKSYTEWFKILVDQNQMIKY